MLGMIQGMTESNSAPPRVGKTSTAWRISYRITVMATTVEKPKDPAIHHPAVSDKPSK